MVAIVASKNPITPARKTGGPIGLILSRAKLRNTRSCFIDHYAGAVGRSGAWAAASLGRMLMIRSSPQ